MSIRFDCPNCGKRLKAEDDWGGRPVKCSGCGAVAAVPGGPEPPRRSPVAAGDDEGPIKFHVKPDEEEGIDMTAMVDVTFFLLIFFMVTSIHSLQASLEMPPPDSQDASTSHSTLAQVEADDTFVVVRVDRDDTIWVDDSEAPSRQDLLAKLRDAHDRDGATNLLVLAHGDARHESVVMALDAGASVGMESVRLTTEDEE